MVYGAHEDTQGTSDGGEGGGPSGAGVCPSPRRRVAGLRVVAFDLDGVIYRGSRLLPGVAEALAAVADEGLMVRFVTNNSSAHRSTVAARLRDFGLPVTAEQVLSSGAAAATYLRGTLGPGASVMVVGGEGLLQELGEAGLRAWHAGAGAGPPPSAAGDPGPDRPPDAPAAVVVGLDRSFTYETLAAAQAAILAGALFVATNTDATYPAEDRVLPGAGSVVAAVATASGRAPLVMGKPEPTLARLLAEGAGVLPEEVLFVGDRLDTDVVMARRAGMVAVLVLTGVTTPEALRAAREAGQCEYLPDHVLDDLTGLPGLLRRLAGAFDPAHGPSG